MRRKIIYVFVMLFIPVVPALAEVDKFVEQFNQELSDILRSGMLSGFFTVFKLLWPYLLVIIFIRIAFSIFEKKIKEWKRNKKNNQKRF
jgi:type II secretory pathway component PulF